MKNFLSILLAPAAAIAATAQADAALVAHFPMDVRGGQITEQISGERYYVQGHFTPENLPGAEGQALRFDGYTSYINARLGNIIAAGTKSMTVSMWVAVPCYPIIKIDENTSEQTPIATCLDETKKTGFGFYIGFDGRYSFRTYIGGWPVNINVTSPLPTYQWNNLTAVIDGDSRTVTLYNNGKAVGAGRANGEVNFSACEFKMGRGDVENYAGPFLLTSYNGLIDDIKIWDEAIPEATVASWKAENPADLDIPASRFADEILRPRFHGMPAAAWTNECHGMWYADGRYHLFFQKNADGPYMARLHWGHISSENLFDWREEKIAIAPGAPYDIKGCWSGCVFADEQITGGKPNILYTAVDYGRATIAQAYPDDTQLINWTKTTNNPIIDGRPGGLSDDFRDPYFFSHNGKAYIIVGSSKDGVGTTTLHQYDPSTKTWSNDGRLFFTGTTAQLCGSFWEMPNITEMEDGKWLFTVTPLGTSVGVRTLYWTGTISDSGQFEPDEYSRSPRTVEMESRDGFGLLSPTIYRHNGKTIVLGIVPDKLPSEDNWDLGWAHCYSLPREWSLGERNQLVQKPFSGLEGMRASGGYSRSAFTLNGTESLAPVSGRAFELCGTFEVGTNPVGFNIFKNSQASATITYNPRTNEVVADFSRVARLVNDGGVYGGVYRCALPEMLRRGSDLKLNIFVDHSIVDIFINDCWATSIRAFPTATDADGVEVFANGGDVTVKDLRAWNLVKSGGSAITDVFADSDKATDGKVDVYLLPSGQKIHSQVNPSEIVDTLPSGMYIVGNDKIMIK